MRSTNEVAYLHLGQPDDEFNAVAAALLEEGTTAVPVRLDDVENVDWERFDLVSLRMCRGFQERGDLVEQVGVLHCLLRAAGQEGKLVNPFGLVLDGLDRSVHLPLLERAGIRTVPTRWLGPRTWVTLREVMDREGWSDVVVKPAVPSRSWRTCRVSADPMTRQRGEHHHVLPDGGRVERLFGALAHERVVGVQPFMSNVLVDGETSFVFLGGEFSHAVHRSVPWEEWSTHELSGSRKKPLPPSSTDVAWAGKVFETLTEHYGPLLFARVDALADEGGPRLLNCELVTPRLFLGEGGAVHTYARKVARRAAAHRALRPA